MSIGATDGAARSNRDRGAAEPARFALLGLLLDRPAHGYDLSRHFDRTSALGDVIHLSSSHLYALLGRLERAGLITGEMQDVGNHPQRRVYRLTDPGREAVLCWVDEPVSHPRDMRLDFPLKLYIARRLGPDHARDLIARQRATFDEYITGLEAERPPAAGPDDAAFLDLMRQARIGRAQSSLDWLDHCEAWIAHHPPGPRNHTAPPHPSPS